MLTTAGAHKGYRLVLIALVLLLGGYLRAVGLTWGLESGYGHMRNYQPDEFVSLRGVLQVDLLAGKLAAPAAYFEGTFNYYLWAVPVAVTKALHRAVSTSHPPDVVHVRQILYSGRIMTVVFDVVTIAVVFLAVYEATTSFWPGWIASLFYAVIPMQVIYAHFMRTHVLANLLCALVFWLAIKSLRVQKWWMLFTCGILAGLGAATHYPTIVIAAIPCLYFLSARSNKSIPSIRESAFAFLSGPLWWIGFGCLAGLFIGEPALFVTPRSVINAISTQTFNHVPSHAFAMTSLFDLSRLGDYCLRLIPYGMYPWLWIIAYGAIFYLCFRPRLYPLSIPIFIFSLLYIYPMAKGYSAALYARAAMLLFPGFAILVGLAFQDLFAIGKRIVTALSACLAAVVILPSVVFDWAYVNAMQQTDVRTLLAVDLKRTIDDSAATIGVVKGGGFFYTSMPAVEHLKNPLVSVRLQDPTQEADFLVIGLTSTQPVNKVEAAVTAVEKGGKFKLKRIYLNQPRLFQQAIDLAKFPPDMTYPFPTLILFAAAHPTF